VQRAVALDAANARRIAEFTYLQRQQERQYDGSGKLKQTIVKTWEISFMEGSPYRRLVARNDQPLSPEERKSEDDRLRFTADQRRKESQADRQKRVAEWERHIEKQREPMQEVPDAFDFRWAAEETVAGEPAFVIDAAPKPGYKPRSSAASYLPKLKARFWIAKKDFQWLKLQAETLDTIAFGGILLRLAKGGVLSIEQGRVEAGLCLPTHLSIDASARVALIKVVHTQADYTLSDYRRAIPSEHSRPSRVRNSGYRPLRLSRLSVFDLKPSPAPSRATMTATMNTKIVVRKFGVLSLAKIMGLLYALIGLIVGAFVSLFAVVGAAFMSSSSSSALLGVGAIIVFPILYGVLGFVGGVISAALYNLLAGMIGGIEIEGVQTNL
jgi:hypothetical protein